MAFSHQTEQFLRVLSLILGWTYTLSWSVSFYPQPYLNWKRHTTRGSSIDYAFLNLVAFICYTTSTFVLLFSPTIRSQYAARHPHSPEPTARVNDLAFGAHAVIMVFITYLQYFKGMWGLNVPESQRVAYTVRAVVAACVIMVVTVTILVFIHNGAHNQDPTTWAWLDVIYAIGNVKLIGTFFKYMPQVILNYRRKSTAGWSIHQVLLDIIGGVLSLAQLTIDAGLQNDWSGIIGNPLKLGLGNITICYDTILIIQHYVIYRHRRNVEVKDDQSPKGERAPLLQAA